MPKPPKISVITANRNGELWLRETIESVLAQDFDDYEHIIVDGASTDGSVEILKQYPHLRWISEPDQGAVEAFRKAIAMATGDNIMVTCASDGFLCRKWFRRCIDALDADPELSLVWGISIQMSEEGDLGELWRPDLLDRQPPDKRDYLSFWLATGLLFPELNYCIRREVFQREFPQEASGELMASHAPFEQFVANLNMNGYLPRFLPIVANFGRTHKNQHGEMIKDIVANTDRQYRSMIRAYTRDLVRGRVRHSFRAPSGEVIGTLSAAEVRMLPFVILWRTVSDVVFRVVSYGKVRAGFTKLSKRLSIR